MITPQVPIAKEGYPFIGFSAFTTLLLALLGYKITPLIFLCITFFILMFFRDPERFIPETENSVICPADGKIIVIEEIDDHKFLQQKAIKISIFMNIFNVHVNRAPMSGTVEKIIHSPGKFYSADSAQGALHNENCATILKTKSKHSIAFVQVAGLIARRIVCWLEAGDTIQQGRRFGLIRFGSRVDLYLPLNTEITVAMGQKVRSGETILANLPTNDKV
jgi:phosphatidylserine decarboxylase